MNKEIINKIVFLVDPLELIKNGVITKINNYCLLDCCL